VLLDAIDISGEVTRGSDRDGRAEWIDPADAEAVFRQGAPHAGSITTQGSTDQARIDDALAELMPLVDDARGAGQTLREALGNARAALLDRLALTDRLDSADSAGAGSLLEKHRITAENQQ